MNIPSFNSLVSEINKIKAIQWLIREVRRLDEECSEIYPPEGGVPKTDLAQSVQDSLTKADNSVSTPEGAGSPGQVLQLDNEGNPSWTTPSAGTVPDAELDETSTNAVQNKVITK